MRILLTGPTGQIGSELLRALPALGEVIAVDRARMDLTDPEGIRKMVRSIGPDLVVNAAGYTDVDRAEREKELARRINATAPGILAQEASRLGAAIIHYSTDYVFNGRATSPYTSKDDPDPINVYGRTKLAGERAVLGGDCAALILRTSWVYSTRGSNFLVSILEQMELGDVRPDGNDVEILYGSEGFGGSDEFGQRVRGSSLRHDKLTLVPMVVALHFGLEVGGFDFVHFASRRPQ